MFTVDCNCKPCQPYGDGTPPLFFTDPVKAEWMYRKLKETRKLYWGVHLDGQHVIGRPP